LIASAAMIGGFTQSPTLSGEVKITNQNIPINELSIMLLNTLEEYNLAIQSKEYGDGIFPFFDYLIAENNLTLEKTNNENFKNNLYKLIPEIPQKNLAQFMVSPITFTILKDKKVSEDLKKQLQNKNNPYIGEIRAIESLLLMRMGLEMGLGLNLIISDSFVNDFYNKNEINKFIDMKEAFAYLQQFTTHSNELNIIIEKFSKLNDSTYNQKAIIQLANTLLLTEKSKDGLNSFVFGDYANK
jgi:hypothetical protein